MRVMLLILALTASALADPAAEQSAKEHYARGKALASQRQFAEAFTEFSIGFDLSDRPAFLFNMAECKRLLGDAQAARELYRQYVQTTPQGELADLARTRLAELGPGAPPPVAPKAVASAKGIDLRVHAEPAPPPLMPALVEHPASSPPVWQRTSFWVGIGAAVVVGSVAIYAATRGPSCTAPMCLDLR